MYNHVMIFVRIQILRLRTKYVISCIQLKVVQRHVQSGALYKIQTYIIYINNDLTVKPNRIDGSTHGY